MREGLPAWSAQVMVGPEVGLGMVVKSVGTISLHSPSGCVGETAGSEQLVGTLKVHKLQAQWRWQGAHGCGCRFRGMSRDQSHIKAECARCPRELEHGAWPSWQGVRAARSPVVVLVAGRAAHGAVVNVQLRVLAGGVQAADGEALGARAWGEREVAGKRKAKGQAVRLQVGTRRGEALLAGLDSP